MKGRMLFVILLAGAGSMALLTTALLTTAQTAREAADLVRVVAQKQGDRPFWFILNSQVLNRIPFVYQASVSRTRFDSAGSAQTTDTASWCSAYVDGGNSGVQCLRERALLSAARRPQPNQKVNEAQRFWEEFRKAFVFETLERSSRAGRPTTVVSFLPGAGYTPTRKDDTAIFPYIRGQIWIDDSDLEICHFEYEFFKDSSALVFGQVLTGTRYSMDMEKQLDDVWLPTRAETELRLSVMSSTFHEASSVQFDDYFR